MSKEKLITGLSLAVLILIPVFLYGYLVEKRKLPPHATLTQAYDAMASLATFGEVVPPNRLRFVPESASRETFTVHKPEAVMPGYYAVSGWDHYAKSYSAWLYDHTGDLKHTWVMNYMAYDPDGPSNGTESPHGFKVLADGSILANHDRGDVLARIDACGDAVWVVNGVFHHSIEPAEDGTFWTWQAKDTAYSHYQYLVNFDPSDGQILKSIGLVEDVMSRLPDGSPTFLFRPDYPFDERPVGAGSPRDLFHPNDVEALPSHLSDAFPQFDAGDLLISLRNLNMVAVISPDDYEVKWASYGPWRLQHDPDFTEDGKITVYNNNTRLRRSEIVSIDPVSGATENPLGAGNTRFYSAAMGKQQRLPNGSTLLAVPGEGRVLLSDKNGDLVLEINNIASNDRKFNAHIGNGLWLPSGYFDSLPSCAQ